MLDMSHVPYSSKNSGYQKLLNFLKALNALCSLATQLFLKSRLVTTFIAEHWLLCIALFFLHLQSS